MTNATKIAIHKNGSEGGLHIDANSGEITTPNNEFPDWADGYSKADLTEFAQWRDSRFGAGAPEDLKNPQLLEAGMLSWTGVDLEGDLVEIEADDLTRTTKIAHALGLDVEDEAFEKKMEGAITEVMVEHDMTINPTTEASLKEAEGLDFNSEAVKKTSNG